MQSSFCNPEKDWLSSPAEKKGIPRSKYTVSLWYVKAVYGPFSTLAHEVNFYTWAMQLCFWAVPGIRSIAVQ